jgi:UDP-N-acetylmuramate dehydrogenase
MANLDKIIKEALNDVVKLKILFNEPMSHYASFSAGGNADALVIIENEDQLIDVVTRLKKVKIDFLPVGNITNIIVRDGGYRGAILLMKDLNTINYKNTPEGGHYIYAQAGASLSSVVNRALAEELTGLEFCAGIPGSVGGAIRMNAGAYGKEMKDVTASIFLFETEGGKKELPREHMAFRYRNSGLSPKAIILAANFVLQKGQPEQIKQAMQEIIQWRKEKHPLEYPNAGSVFKNIPGQPAGRLIEELGIKGMSCGDAQVSHKHANFIINRGKATASDILKLMALIQAKAKKEKGISLEPEVVIIGEE